MIPFERTNFSGKFRCCTKRKKNCTISKSDF